MKEARFVSQNKEKWEKMEHVSHLDTDCLLYTSTVYGEVIEVLDVLDKIAAVKTNSFDRPVKDVVIEKIRR